MSFVTEIMNPFLIVRNKIRNNRGEWVDMKKKEERLRGTRGNLNVTMGDNIELLNTYGKKTIVEKIVVSVNVNINLGMHLGDGDAYSQNVALTTAPWNHSLNSGLRPLSMRSIREIGNPLFEIVFDSMEEESDTYGVTYTLKRPFEFPEGCRINLYTTDSIPDGHAHYQIIYREIDE